MVRKAKLRCHGSRGRRRLTGLRDDAPSEARGADGGRATHGHTKPPPEDITRETKPPPDAHHPGTREHTPDAHHPGTTKPPTGTHTTRARQSRHTTRAPKHPQTDITRETKPPPRLTPFGHNKAAQPQWGRAAVAVALGFEPRVAVTPHSISSAAPSAARTRYLTRILYYRNPRATQIDPPWEQRHTQRGPRSRRS